MSVPASYFDGKTSRRHQVVLTVEGDVACISGEVDRRCPLSQLRVSEASQHGMRLVTFPDGAYLEIGDQQGFARMLSATGHTDSLVSRLQPPGSHDHLHAWGSGRPQAGHGSEIDMVAGVHRAGRGEAALAQRQHLPVRH